MDFMVENMSVNLYQVSKVIKKKEEVKWVLKETIFLVIQIFKIHVCVLLSQ